MIESKSINTSTSIENMIDEKKQEKLTSLTAVDRDITAEMAMVLIEIMYEKKMINDATYKKIRKAGK